MKQKLSGAHVLIGLLFVLISLLLSAIGLKLNLKPSAYNLIFSVGMVGFFGSALFLLAGAIFLTVKKSQKLKPSQMRNYFNSLFKMADERESEFLKKVKKSNFLVYLHFNLVVLLGAVFYVCSSFCFFYEPVYFTVFPFILVAITPLWRILYCFLNKEPKEIEGGIKKDEYPYVYSIFESEIKKAFGINATLALDFDKADIVSVEKQGKTVSVNLSSYAFMLFSKEELIAVLNREILKIKDEKYNKIQKLIYSRAIFTSEIKASFFFKLYFSFAVYNTARVYAYVKRALLRLLDKRADELVKNTEYAENYLLAVKKQGVFDAYTEDSRSAIGLKICSSDQNIKEMVNVVYQNFLDLYSLYGKEWEEQVEVRLKPAVTDRLTFKEKSVLFGYLPKIESVENFADAEEKALYDKYNEDYYQSAKYVYEPQRTAYENFYNETLRYEQDPNAYDERLKLIGVAHAYYTLAKFDKAEDVYKKIIESGDESCETLFDYGCFLLVAKRDKQGVDYIYKAMENENLVEDGLEILGKYFINSGDIEGYDKYCEFKDDKLDELVGDISNKVLNVSEKLKKPVLDSVLLNEIIEKLSKDDNITEIYCANAKTQAGKDILLFAIAMRNKTEGAFMETYERVFSILDNDYAKLDSFLISTDLEPKNKIVLKIKGDGDFKVFDRKEI